MDAKPTILFATMCKNEAHCIRDTLESVYKFIDYWVVHDTGSTDRTCEVVEEFFKEKGIPGELFIEEWQGFDVNKTKLFDRCFGKADYIFHLDADDILCGDLIFTKEDRGYLQYLIKTKRGSSEYKCSVLFDNSVHWKFVGVAHTLVKCLDNPEKLKDRKDLSDRPFSYMSRDTGARSQDPEKYLKDALRLRDQFYKTLVDDPDGFNARALFYMAQSYYDQQMYQEAAQYYSLYTKLKENWIEEAFESNLRLISCLAQLKYPVERVIQQAEKTMKIFPDRAEPYYVIGKYLNDNRRPDLAYPYLLKAKQQNLDDVKKKYTLFVRRSCYGKFVNDELAVACYWTKRFADGITLIEEILEDSDFTVQKDRLIANLNFCKKGLNPTTSP